MIIAVSDVHLGCQGSQKDVFMRFLDACDTARIDHLVLCGDIFDFWRRNNAQVIVENADVLEKLGRIRAKDVYYIVGNHDYYLYRISHRYDGHFHIPVHKSVRLTDGGRRFYFIHGYEIDVLANYEPLSIESYENFCERMCFSEDLIGEYASNFWNWFENRKIAWWKMKVINTSQQHQRLDLHRMRALAASKGRYFLLGMHPEEYLVYGHTHDPYVSADGMVANTGCWFDEQNGRRHRNTYVRIEDGKMEVKDFDEKNFP
jgi:UDP-2,3-diacylglucosamine pyrophosphatase LpxH